LLSITFASPTEVTLCKGGTTPIGAVMLLGRHPLSEGCDVSPPAGSEKVWPIKLCGAAAAAAAAAGQVES